MANPNIPYQEITYKIIGCAMKVHRCTQRGYREKHYQRALDQEMLKAGLVTEMEYHKEIYHGQIWLGRLYLDHWVNESIVVEVDTPRSKDTGILGSPTRHRLTGQSQPSQRANLPKSKFRCAPPY